MTNLLDRFENTVDDTTLIIISADCSNKKKVNGVLINFFTIASQKNMTIYLYILGMIIKYWVLSNADGKLIITMNGHKTLLLETKFNKQVFSHSSLHIVPNRK